MVNVYLAPSVRLWLLRAALSIHGVSTSSRSMVTGFASTWKSPIMVVTPARHPHLYLVVFLRDLKRGDVSSCGPLLIDAHCVTSKPDWELCVLVFAISEVLKISVCIFDVNKAEYMTWI